MTLAEQGLYDHLDIDQLKALADRLFADATATAAWAISQGLSTDMADAKMREAIEVEKLHLVRMVTV